MRSCITQAKRPVYFALTVLTIRLYFVPMSSEILPLDALADITAPDIDRCVNKYVYHKTFSAAACMGSVGQHIFHRAQYGTLREPPPLQKTPPHTFFDLASLTKPLGTGLAALHLVSRNRMDLGAPLSSTLPQFRNSRFEHITIDMLLDHTSGFPATLPLWKDLVEHDAKVPNKDKLIGTPDAHTFAKESIAGQKLAYEPGRQCLYSDVGFLVLGWVIEHITGKRLDDFLMREIYRPLGLHEELFFVPLGEIPTKRILKKRIFAATEACDWRDKLVQGEVHDPNAWALGGICGHAGLFGSVEAVWLLMVHLWASFRGTERSFLAGGVRRFWTRSRRIRGMTRTLAWDTPTVNHSSAGKRFSKNAVGHLGFTGCSIWLDLSTDVLGVVLSNHAHYPKSDSEHSLEKFRPRIYDLFAKEGESLPQQNLLNRGSQAFLGTRR
jgi:serine-type D-Ala-D-Ala carboxypeptidase